MQLELKARAGGLGVAAWETEDKGEYIYALFKTRPDIIFGEMAWDNEKVMELIKEFESNVRNKPVNNVGRRSADPRLLPLRDVLKAKK